MYNKAGVDKIVFSSTAATYCEPDEIPIEETTTQKPINPYGKSKLMIENIMDDADKAYGLKSIRLRYFNVAGSSTDGKLGEEHNPETHLIPKFYMLQKPKKKVKVENHLKCLKQIIQHQMALVLGTIFMLKT